jgi:hypothetical protein
VLGLNYLSKKIGGMVVKVFGGIGGIKRSLSPFTAVIGDFGMTLKIVFETGCHDLPL